ncbi:MAG: aminotransferase class IV, partial [Hydrocarboniphaga effusa]|nr:aminotransferase class IV [Hydrocarboniphaga effusa]
MLAGVKHLNRLEQILASREWEPGADEGLLADDQNRPVSGTRGNLFWVGQGALRTSALDRCGVAGLMRGKVLQAAAALGLPYTVAEGSWNELESADEVFVTNSLIGLWPVRAMGDKSWAAPGPVTRRLMEAIKHPQLRDV